MPVYITGGLILDLIHSPVQCLEPGWSKCADFEPECAKVTHKPFLERYGDTDTLVCAPCLPMPSRGCAA